LCTKCWSFSISYPDLIKLPYFAGPHSFKEGIGGEKRPKEDKVEEQDDFKENAIIDITLVCVQQQVQLFLTCVFSCKLSTPKTIKITCQNPMGIYFFKKG
jgi:hypothetical protein